eukprot:SAG31_NODE_37680_length_302_cov_0.763547_2_plen_33_part_01
MRLEKVEKGLLKAEDCEAAAEEAQEVADHQQAF